MPDATNKGLQAYTKLGIAQTFRLTRYDSWTRNTTGQQCQVVSSPQLSDSQITLNLEADRLDGYKFPAWEQYVAAGLNATTPLAAYRERFKWTPGVAEARRKPDLCKIAQAGTIVHYDTVGMTGSPIRPSPDPRYAHADWDSLTAVADNKARVAFLEDCRQAETLFEGLVWLGELPETLAFIRSGWRTLARKLTGWGNQTQRDIRKIRRQNSKASPAASVRALAEFLGNSWLTVQFALKPVVNDIANASATLLEYGNPKNASRVEGFGKAELTTTSIRRTTSASGLYLDSPEDIRRTVKVTYLGAWDNAHATLAGQPATFGWDPVTWGLQLDRLVPSIYELIPYSWLVDYFVNFGDMVNALSTRTYNVKWVQRTEIRETVAVVKDGRYFTPYPQTDEVLPGSVPPTWTWTRKYVTRAEHLGDLYPTLMLQLPGLTSQRWLNVAALLAARLGPNRHANPLYGEKAGDRLLKWLAS